MTNWPTLNHPLKSIAIDFVLTYGTARAIAAARNLECKTLPPESGPLTGGAAALRFRVSSTGSLNGLRADIQTHDAFGELNWSQVCSVELGGTHFDGDAIIGLAFQRLMQMVREQVSHTVVNDGQAIKYDLGVL
jgi:hypothetical protein